MWIVHSAVIEWQIELCGESFCKTAFHSNTDENMKNYYGLCYAILTVGVWQWTVLYSRPLEILYAFYWFHSLHNSKVFQLLRETKNTVSMKGVQIAHTEILVIGTRAVFDFISW